MTERQPGERVKMTGRSRRPPPLAPPNVPVMTVAIANHADR